uniref:NADH-ubiquinone oxidoreductase chain 2 n=1 Tax=Pleurobranchaea sp. TY-2016 TaxID=1883447 RepID=A0A1C9M3L1_9GAST|nr:NADH dehydrogenase subunit 2 [Pleurobranchaea sp. TY-2016]
MLLGPFLAVSSSNWLICWVGVEISFLGLIPILLSDFSFSSLSKESSMKYFCIQAMGSGLLLCGGVLIFMFPFNFNFFLEIIFFVSLMIKLGVFPAHFWVPSVVSGLGWLPMFILLTWQKVPPFFFLVNFMKESFWLSEILLILGGISAVVGAFIGLNQSKISPMLGASSITHTGWVVLGAVYGSLWIYFILYCITFGFMLYFFSMEDMMFSGLGVLSLSGLPPFAMFLGKWMILKSALLSSFSYWFLLLPLFGSVISLFFYLKFFYSFFLEEENYSVVKLSYFGSFSVMALIGIFYIIVF